MKKILLVGILNKNIQEMYDSLSRRYQVQIGGEVPKQVEGILAIVKPDMVIVNVVELDDVDNQIFEHLKETYSETPILVVGTKEGCGKYNQYLKLPQVKEMVRPIGRDKLVNQCALLLNQFAVSTDRSQLTDGGENEDVEKKKCILVVDDSSVVLRSIKVMLEPKYKVMVATSGEMALKAMQKKRPDLVLLDYEMPEWNGKVTLEKMREDEELCEIPVIFLTGVADKEHIAAVLGLNPAGYFLKPPNRERLMQAIEETVTLDED